jgi:transcriptional regulator with XRE-family HTH domain
MKVNALGQILKDARKAQRLTQMDLSDLSGVSPSVIYKLESGRMDIAVASLQAVTDALGVEIFVRSPLGGKASLNG